MKRQILLFGLLILFSNCKSGGNKINESSVDKTNIERKSDIEKIKISDLLIDYIDIDTSKVLDIKENCIVVIQMTSQESDEFEKSNPTGYEVYSENANNSAENALDLFDKLKIKNFWTEKRYIKFNSEGKNYLIDTRLKKIVGTYCVLFHDNLKPELLTLESINEETLNNYLKN